MIPGPLELMIAAEEVVHVSPRRNKSRLPVPMLLFTAVAKSDAVIAVTPGVAQKPDGASVKLPDVEKQIVLAPANTTSGSSTTILTLVFSVFVPSKTVKQTV
jgi:hypothetical protein